MDDMDVMEEPAVLVAGVHRSVRWLDGQESAFAGELVADGELLRVRVDALAVPDVLWRFAAAEHVGGVRDVVRRSDGHDALLPWCAESVDVFLARRETAERPLLAGEIVTLVGSMLRGVVETADETATPGEEEVQGRWWLDHDMRPLFVPGAGSSCAGASVEIIARIRERCADRAMERTLGDVLAGAADPRAVIRSIDLWEAELTELAAPRPLEREVHPPERVSAIPLHQALLPQEAQRVVTHRSLQLRARRYGAAMLGWLRDRRPRRPVRIATSRTPGAKSGAGPAAGTGGRGRMLLIGAAVAAVVLLGGLLWPTSGDSSATEAHDRASTSAGASEDAAAPADTASPGEKTSPPRPTAAETAPPTPDDADDEPARKRETAEQSAAALLRAIASCGAAGDSRCADVVVDGAGESVMQRLGGADPAREITPVEDYGDIAVVRLGAVGEHGDAAARGEQMLVMVRDEEEWLVRDVYDVADQPSDAG